MPHPDRREVTELPTLTALFGANHHFALYWIVLARIGGVFAVAPIVSSAAIPAPVRAALSVLVAIAALPAAAATAPHIPIGVVPYSALLVHELAVGLIIGFVARVVFSVADMAGSLIDLQMGFSVGSAVDPLYGESSTVLGTFLNMLAMLLFLVAGGLELLVAASAASYTHLPIGAPAFFGAGSAAAVSALAWAMATAVAVAVPALALGLVLNLALGLVGRAVPQLNVFASALPLQVIAGLVALLLSLPVMAVVFSGLAGETVTWIGRLVP